MKKECEKMLEYDNFLKQRNLKIKILSIYFETILIHSWYTITHELKFN